MTTLMRMLALFASLLALPRLFLALDEDGGKDDDTKDEDESTDDDSGDDDKDEDAKDSDSGDDDGDDDEPPKKFTQADLDAAIDKRLARERRKHERELEKAKGKADGKGKDAKGADSQAEERVTKAQSRVVRTEAKAAALAAGVDPKRVARFLRLVELDDPGEFLSDDDEPDEEAISAAVEEALEDVPEFKAKTGDDGEGKRRKGKSGGDGMNGDGQRKQWTRAEIDGMSAEEIDKHWDSIQAAMKAGAIK